MTAAIHPAGGNDPMTERHPALITVVALVTLVLVGGLAGLLVGRLLVQGVQLLLGPVSSGA